MAQNPDKEEVISAFVEIARLRSLQLNTKPIILLQVHVPKELRTFLSTLSNVWSLLVDEIEKVAWLLGYTTRNHCRDRGRATALTGEMEYFEIFEITIFETGSGDAKLHLIPLKKFPQKQSKTETIDNNNNKKEFLSNSRETKRIDVIKAHKAHKN